MKECNDEQKEQHRHIIKHKKTNRNIKLNYAPDMDITCEDNSESELKEQKPGYNYAIEFKKFLDLKTDPKDECEETTNEMNPGNSNTNLHYSGTSDGNLIIERQQNNEVCEKSDIMQKNIQNHSNLLSNKLAKLAPNGKSFICEICNRVFTQGGSLKIHYRTHTHERPFKCDYCEKVFIHNGNLKSHLRTHTREKPYRCDECGKSFTQSGSLKLHMRIHTKEKPYQCHICYKDFIHRGNLNVHFRVHEVERSLQCEICDRVFPKYQSLKLHSRTHAMKK